MTRLSRYILRETLGTWLAVTTVLVVILLTNQVAGVLERAAEGGFPRSMLLELIGFGLLQNIGVLLPVGLLLGVMLAFGRLYHDSEMTAAISCGVEPRRIFAPVFGLAVGLALLVGWVSLVAAPDAAARVQTLRSTALQAGEFAPISPGSFRSFGGGSAVLYAQSVNPEGELQRVFVKRSRGERIEIAVAERARHDISADGTLHTLTLFDGERYEGIPGQAEFRRVRFAENVIPVRVPPLRISGLEIESVASRELWVAADAASLAELHWRIALPLMVLVLAVLAVPLSRLRPRQGRYSRIWLAIVLYFIYISLTSAARVWLEKSLLPTWMGLWWVHLLVIAAAALVIAWPDWRARRRYRLRQIRQTETSA